MSIRNDYEYGSVGDGGFGGFGGGSSLLWFVILIIFAVLFWNKRDGHDGFGGGCGCNPIMAGTRNVFADESNWEEENHLRAEEEKTRGLIVHEAEKQAAREFQKELAEKAELKNKIYLLENEKYTDAKFDKLTALVQHDYNSLYREIERRPAAAPCFAPTCSQPLCQPCLMNPCDNASPRRCDC